MYVFIWLDICSSAQDLVNLKAIWKQASLKFLWNTRRDFWFMVSYFIGISRSDVVGWWWNSEPKQSHSHPREDLIFFMCSQGKSGNKNLLWKKSGKVRQKYFSYTLIFKWPDFLCLQLFVKHQGSIYFECPQRLNLFECYLGKRIMLRPRKRNY